MMIDEHVKDKWELYMMIDEHGTKLGLWKCTLDIPTD